MTRREKGKSLQIVMQEVVIGCMYGRDDEDDGTVVERVLWEKEGEGNAKGEPSTERTGLLSFVEVGEYSPIDQGDRSREKMEIGLEL